MSTINTPWGPMTADVEGVTDQDLVTAGLLIDVSGWGVTLNGRPINTVSNTLIADLLTENGELAVGPADIKQIVATAVDTSEPGEPSGFLYEAPTPWAETVGAKASGREDRIWMERCGDGWSMYYPSER